MTSFHPTLVSKKFNETINFYEDYFGFRIALEEDRLAILQLKDDPKVCLSVYDIKYASEGIKPVSGLVLNVPCKDVQAVYEQLYMEGLEMHKELGHDFRGNHHFIVRDPNGVLINVTEPMRLETV